MTEFIPDVPVLRLVDRLRGIYTVAVKDGAGLLNGRNTFTASEPYKTPPIQHEAAAKIEELTQLLRDIIVETKNWNIEYDEETKELFNRIEEVLK